MYSGNFVMFKIARTILQLVAMIMAVQGVANGADTPQQPLVVKNNASNEERRAPKVSGVSPSPVIASDEKQRIIIKGSGFTKGSRVALSRGGQIEVWPASDVEYLSSKELAVNVITGQVKAKWSVMVGNEDNRTSNLFGFTVAPGGSAKAGNKPKASGKSTGMNERRAEAAQGVSAISAGQTAQLLGSNWYKAQPGTHYTIQLLASNSRMNLMMIARKHPELAPLASFMMEKNGGRLHVLTSGSYPSRAAAEEAKKGLPPGLEPWSRTITSIQDVMATEPDYSGTMSKGDAAEGIMTRDTAWVWTQNPEHYTIQLAAAGSQQAIVKAIQQSSLTGDAVIVKIQRQARPWYLWIYGSYASKVEAETVIERLPHGLKKDRPWIRRFANVQDELSQTMPLQ